MILSSCFLSINYSIIFADRDYLKSAQHTQFVGIYLISTRKLNFHNIARRWSHIIWALINIWAIMKTANANHVCHNCTYDLYLNLNCNQPCIVCKIWYCLIVKTVKESLTKRSQSKLQKLLSIKVSSLYSSAWDSNYANYVLKPSVKP